MKSEIDHWRRALIDPSAKIESAIALLDAIGLRIVLVTDKDGRLLGTLTDGDVRRALLKHLPLDLEVSKVMNPSPIVAKLDWHRSKTLSVMEDNRLLQIPIVDGDGRLIGLEDIHDLLSIRHHDNPVFLMAGGFGTRLRPLTDTCPKPMLKVGEKPILEQILVSFVNSGFHRFYISTHYLAEMIQEYFGDGSRWGISIKYIHEETPLGTGGALGLLPHEEIDLPLFVMNGDLLTSIDFDSLLDFHEASGGLATICARQYEHRIPYGVITNEGSRIKGMVEKPVQSYFVNAGIYILSPEIVTSVKPGTCIDMPTLLGEKIGAGTVVNMFPVHESWLDIGQMEDFNRAQEYVSEN